jgi:glutaredoxin-like YruB-family protein
MASTRQNGAKVKLYTTQTCAWCRVAKAYLKDNEIDYAEVDIVDDLDGRREMLVMTGQYGVPVVLVGDKAMVGWNPDEFETLLATWNGAG